MSLGRVFFVAAAAAALSGAASADVHLLRTSGGSAMIFNDRIGSGWRVEGKAPTDRYLVDRRNAASAYDATIETWSRHEGIDPSLVKSVMLVESHFNPRAVSRKGAGGLMQLMPETARRFGVKDRFDAVENIKGGVKLLAELLALYGGNVPLALAGYNAGTGAVSRYSGVPPYAETQEYVRRTMIAYKGEAIPVVGGSFRGMKTALAKPGPPVKVSTVNGTRIFSNTGAFERPVPLLGRAR